MAMSQQREEERLIMSKLGGKGLSQTSIERPSGPHVWVDDWERPPTHN